jgi:hypothetical protein
MTSRARAAMLLLFVSLFGCGDDPQGRPEPAVSNSGAVDGPNLGGKLGNAANSIAGASSKPMTADQPPPTGIFDEGLADKAFPLNAAPKLDLISEGSDPKIQLLAGPFEEVQSIAMKVELEGALPALIVELEIGPPKPGAPAPEPGKDKKDEKAKPAPKPGASAAPAAAPAEPQPLMPKPAGDYALVATVKKVRVAAAGNEKDAAKLQVLLDLMNGSTISFTMTKTGPKGFTRTLLHKPEGEAGQILDLELSAVEEGLSVLYAPAPEKPVGEGASWVVTDRRISFGSDAVRYRHFQLKRVQGDAAGIQVTLRQYATNDKSAFVPPPNVMDQYAAKADGALQIIPKRHFPSGGAMHFEMQSMIVPEEAKGNPRAQHTKFGLELSVEMGQVQVVKPGEVPDGAPAPKGSAGGGGGGKAPAPPKAPPPSP